jgi:carbonic anhydrase
MGKPQDQLLVGMLAGFRRFQQRHFSGGGSLFETLKSRQSPTAMIIACCDSRVDPALLIEARPGDVFVIRNVANLVPPYMHGAEAPGIRSAIEFGVKILGVRHIVVLGHSGCGGVRALMTSDANATAFEFVEKWMTIANEAKAEVHRRMPFASIDAQCRACAIESIKLSVRNLLSFPWVERAVAARTLSIHGWYFDMQNGSLLSPNEDFNGADTLVSGVRSVAVDL